MVLRRTSDASPPFGSRRNRSRAAEGKDRGAVLVEAALVTPLLILLAFGMIDLALLLRAHVAVTTLSREGARTASAEPRVPLFTADAVNAIARSATTLPFERIEVWIYRATDGTGALPSSCDSASTSCVKYVWVDPDPISGAPGKLGNPTGTWAPGSINACIGDAGADYVGVYVKARHDWLVGAVFSGSDTSVAARTVMKFEPVIPRSDATETLQRACK